MAIRPFNNKHPDIGKSVYIDDSAIVIGDVTLGDDVSIWPTSVLRGDVQSIVVGQGSNVQDGCILHVSHDGQYSPGGIPLHIGKGVTIGHRAVVHACTVGNYCLIGIGAVIMDGAILGDYVMLGAGAVVPPGKKLASGFLYIGTPAQQKRPLCAEEKEFLIYSCQHYKRLKDTYLMKDFTD